MPLETDPLALLRGINAQAAFNRFFAITVDEAGPGLAQISMPWREEAGQYAGFLHAGLVGALIDTACGFAAATVAGRVLAAQYSVNCLRPAVGQRFIARAEVVKPGKTLVFTRCTLHAEQAGNRVLVATGETLLTPVPSAPAAPAG
jgi:uncharacterized protein (TIGR00369 family)